MRVAVVGAGISGLALGYYLSERGIESVVYEQSSEPGGVIDTGRVVERGPQRVRRAPGIAGLVGAAGLADELDLVKSTLSETLHRAEGKLIKEFVEGSA